MPLSWYVFSIFSARSVSFRLYNKICDSFWIDFLQDEGYGSSFIFLCVDIQSSLHCSLMKWFFFQGRFLTLSPISRLLQLYRFISVCPVPFHLLACFLMFCYYGSVVQLKISYCDVTSIVFLLPAVQSLLYFQMHFSISRPQFLWRIPLGFWWERHIICI